MSGCSPDIPTIANNLPEVEGRWSYQAFDVRVRSAPDDGVCTIDDVTLDLGPWRYTGFAGRSSGGFVSCSAGLSEFSGPLNSYPVRRGGSVLPHIAFDFGGPEWRHTGMFEPGVITGSFSLVQGPFTLDGSFKAVQVSAGQGDALTNTIPKPTSDR